jgi:hypothetical protein
MGRTDFRGTKDFPSFHSSFVLLLLHAFSHNKENVRNFATIGQRLILEDVAD